MQQMQSEAMGAGGAVTRGPSGHVRHALPVLAAGAFAVGTDAFVIAGILPAVAHGTGVSVRWAGALMTGFALTYAVAAPVLSVTFSRLPRRGLLVAALTGFAVTNALAAAAPSFALLMAARVLAAVAAALFTPTASALAAELAPPGRRGRALAAVAIGLTLARWPVCRWDRWRAACSAGVPASWSSPSSAPPPRSGPGRPCPRWASRAHTLGTGSGWHAAARLAGAGPDDRRHHGGVRRADLHRTHRARRGRPARCLRQPCAGRFRRGSRSGRRGRRPVDRPGWRPARRSHGAARAGRQPRRPCHRHRVRRRACRPGLHRHLGDRQAGPSSPHSSIAC